MEGAGRVSRPGSGNPVFSGPLRRLTGKVVRWPGSEKWEVREKQYRQIWDQRNQKTLIVGGWRLSRGAGSADTVAAITISVNQKKEGKKTCLWLVDRGTTVITVSQRHSNAF